MKPFCVLDPFGVVCSLYVRMFPRRTFPHWLDGKRLARLLSEATTN